MKTILVFGKEVYYHSEINCDNFRIDQGGIVMLIAPPLTKQARLRVRQLISKFQLIYQHFARIVASTLA